MTEAAKDASADPGAERVREPGKRLFVGARLSIATTNALAAAAETIARRARDARLDVRWVAPANYHVTLKFLGWTRATAVGAVRDALDAAARGTPRLTLRVARLGGFPSLDRAAIAWAGVEDAAGGPLAALVTRIDAAMAALGYAAEPRPFHAHVTLGRLRETRPLRDVVLPVAEQMFGDTRVDAMTLFESETRSSGSVYTEISRIAFKSPDPTAERQTRAVDLGARDDTDDGWPRGQHPDAPGSGK